MDDFIETALLNLFFQGSLKAMPARLVSDNQKHVVIRPLVYVTEAEARPTPRKRVCQSSAAVARPAATEPQAAAYQAIDQRIRDEHPDVKNSMITALSNVAPRHLLDRRLNPPREIATRRTDDVAPPQPQPAVSRTRVLTIAPELWLCAASSNA